ncbi:MAG: 3-methyl-2-oxobutanoate dehydrogenase subunit beta [Acidobacteria bacterium]|nr:MAG: 3-methyl-2-oxobutanoate dehydrogenase subunit beta [Acidobacteriota bacterium]
MKRMLTGNVAVVEGAVRAGCRAFFGYPITPASEIAEAAADLMPKVGGVFLQAESEIAAIQMAYGAASAGVRVLTASSGPGISLMQEGISYLAGAELPCVIVDVMRGGPGLGNIGPEQGDYFQMVKGGGHGNYRNIVLAPGSVPEMCDLTVRAFDLADRYRNPAVVLADGVLGQMMESVELPQAVAAELPKSWAVTGEAATRRNLISSIFLEPADLEAHVGRLAEKYRRLEEAECSWQDYCASDADVLVVSYGITSRVARAAVDRARREGLNAGMLRPITLYPFPTQALRQAASSVAAVLVVELSTGQLLEDVRLAVEGRASITHMSRTGGMIPTSEDVLAVLGKIGLKRVRCYA